MRILIRNNLKTCQMQSLCLSCSKHKCAHTWAKGLKHKQCSFWTSVASASHFHVWLVYTRASLSEMSSRQACRAGKKWLLLSHFFHNCEWPNDIISNHKRKNECHWKKTNPKKRLCELLSKYKHISKFKFCVKVTKLLYSLSALAHTK